MFKELTHVNYNFLDETVKNHLNTISNFDKEIISHLKIDFQYKIADTPDGRNINSLYKDYVLNYLKQLSYEEQLDFKNLHFMDKIMDFFNFQVGMFDYNFYFEPVKYVGQDYLNEVGKKKQALIVKVSKLYNKEIKLKIQE